MNKEEIKSVDEKEKELTEEFEKLLKNGKIRYVSNDELYVYSLEIKLDKYKQVIDKIKEIVNKTDYDKWELQMTSIEKLIKIQELLEEIE